MTKSINISEIKFTSGTMEDAERGLLGWASIVVDGGLKVDGITLRRTAAGRFALSFPARRDASGRQHAYVRPLDNSARKEIESKIFAALGLDNGVRR